MTDLFYKIRRKEDGLYREGKCHTFSEVGKAFSTRGRAICAIKYDAPYGGVRDRKKFFAQYEIVQYEAREIAVMEIED